MKYLLITALIIGIWFTEYQIWQVGYQSGYHQGILDTLRMANH